MKKASILLIALMVISVGFLSGCNEEILGIGASAEISNYEIKDDNGITVIKAEISGDSDLEIVLSIDNIEICSKNIKKRQLDDGSEIVLLEICNNKFETPEGGNFKISVYSGDNQIVEEEFYKVGALLTITYLTAESEKFTYSNEKYFNDFTLSYKNIGDLPAYVSQIYMDSGKDYSYKNVAETSQYIGVGDSTTLSGAIFLETYYYADGHIRATLLDSNGNAISLSYTWNEP